MSIEKQILSLRRAYQSRNIRERALLFLFLVAGFLIWSFELMKSHRELSVRNVVVNADLETQQTWLDQEAIIDARMEKVLAQMDSGETFSENQLLQIVDRIARDVGLQTAIARPTSRRGEVFTEHILTIPVAMASMRSMIDFENAIKDHYPFLGIDYLLIEPENSSPDLLKGEVRVTSFEWNQTS